MDEKSDGTLLATMPDWRDQICLSMQIQARRELRKMKIKKLTEDLHGLKCGCGANYFVDRRCIYCG